MHVVLLLDHACNMACSYCYAGEKRQAPMDDDVMRRGVAMCFGAEPARLSFFGGEPLLAFELLAAAVAEAERWSQERGVKRPAFEVTTNGLLLRGELLSFLAAHAFRVVVSLDGTAAAHDACRRRVNGSPTYAEVHENICRALKVLPDLEVLQVVGPETVSEAAAGFEKILAMGVRHLHLSIDFCASWDRAGLVRGRDAFMALADAYVTHYREGVSFRFNLFDAKIASQVRPSRGRSLCPFGLGTVAVAPSGRLYPCERLVGEDKALEMAIGDVYSGLDVGKVQALRAKLQVIPRDCVGCALVGRCMLGCGCVNLVTSGRLDQVTDEVCAWEQIVIGAADAAAARLYAEKNPIFMARFYGQSPAEEVGS